MSRKPPKPRFSDIAVFAADIAEISPSPSITTDVLEWCFTTHPFPELPERLQTLICRQGSGPYIETWSADPEHQATRFHWDGIGTLTHDNPCVGFVTIEWSDEK